MFTHVVFKTHFRKGRCPTSTSTIASALILLVRLTLSSMFATHLSKARPRSTFAEIPFCAFGLALILISYAMFNNFACCRQGGKQHLSDMIVLLGPANGSHAFNQMLGFCKVLPAHSSRALFQWNADAEPGVLRHHVKVYLPDMKGLF